MNIIKELTLRERDELAYQPFNPFVDIIVFNGKRIDLDYQYGKPLWMVYRELIIEERSIMEPIQSISELFEKVKRYEVTRQGDAVIYRLTSF